MPSDSERLNEYVCSDFSAEGWTRPVYRRGDGPGVIVIHEMPGLHPLVVRFADRVAAAGMSVFLPSLFGEPNRTISNAYAAQEMFKGICIRREFSTWSTNRSSPIVDWLRALARHVHAECGGQGVGAVGMCFTGGFALAMMTEPAVRAPVLSQPSLPLPITAAQKRAIDASPDEIRCVRQRMESEDLTLLGLRFRGDPFVPDERFDTLRTTFGDRFEAIEIEPEHAGESEGTNMAPHSVLTIHLNDTDPQGPTRQAEQRVIAFFKNRIA